MKRIFFLAAMVLAISSFAFGQTASTTSDSNDEQMIRGSERKLGEAITKLDKTALGNLMGDDFLSIGSNGVLTDKTQEIEALKPHPSVTLVSFNVQVQKIRIYEGKMAVVTGRDVLNLKTENREASLSFMYTRVYVKRQGRWQIVSQQVTALPPPREGR